MIRRRIVVLGKNALAVEGLRTILAAGDAVVLALADPSDDGEDGWQPSFRRFADSTGVPVRAVADINDPAFVAEIAALRPDFLLSFQAAQLLKAPLLETPIMGALNLHFGPLPRYRGVAPIAWAIINGEAATGVTLHHINVGVDNGPIISSKAVPIRPEDTGRTVYDRCSEAGIELFRESWPHVRLETPAGRPQSREDALYYNRYSIDFSQRSVSWRGDCESIANWMRAFIFPPFQFPAPYPRRHVPSRSPRSAGIASPTAADPGRSSRSRPMASPSRPPAAGSRSAFAKPAPNLSRPDSPPWESAWVPSFLEVRPRSARPAGGLVSGGRFGLERVPSSRRQRLEGDAAPEEAPTVIPDEIGSES